MKRRMRVVVLAWSVGTTAVQAAALPAESTGTPPTTNTTTIMASTALSPGRYTSSLSPNINGDMSDRIAKSLGRVPGVADVKVDSENSAIHFTIKNGTPVLISDVQTAVAKSDHGVVLSLPVLEHSETTHMGL
jgi:hypothetical protein